MNKPAYQTLVHPSMEHAPQTDTEWREFIRVLMDSNGPLGKTSSQGRITDSRALSQGLLSNRSSVMLTGALTAQDDGGTPRINIAAHDLTYSFGDVSYNAGTSIVADFETTYYVFASDPEYLGGSVPYFAFESPDEGVTDDYRYVGAVTTPAAGGADTDGGYGGGFGTGTEPGNGQSWP